MMDKKFVHKCHPTDFRIVETDSDREAVYRFRHKCYSEADTIDRTGTDIDILTDKYDRTDNCFLVCLYINNVVVSTIRIHILSKEQRYSPSLDVFPDVLSPFLEAGHTIIDPTRLATDRSASSRYKYLPFLTIKAACMAIQHFNSSLSLASIREEHVEFYKKVFSADIISEPRISPLVKYPSYLLKTDMVKIMDSINNYQILSSTESERMELFGYYNRSNFREIYR